VLPGEPESDGRSVLHETFRRLVRVVVLDNLPRY
jgi:hypothetical protein